MGTMELQHTDILRTTLSRQKGPRLGVEEREEKGMVLNLIPCLNHLQEVGKSMRFGYSGGWLVYLIQMYLCHKPLTSLLELESVM